MFEALPRLQGLLALSQTPGLDVRPTLLRVLTDFYVDAPHQSRADTLRFGELATHLIDAVDEATRMAVAAKLASCRVLPRPVLNRLLAAEPAVAAQLIRTSAALESEDLWAVALQGDPERSAALAERPDLDPDLVRVLARRGEPAVASALAGNPAAPFDRESVAALAALQAGGAELGARLGAALACHPLVKPSWLAPFLLSLDSATRRAVLEGVRHEGTARPGRETGARMVKAQPDMAEILEAQALAGDRVGLAENLAHLLSDMFAIPAEAAMRTVSDPQGEVLALALLAAGLPVERATRILLGVTPAAQASIAALRDLVALMDATPRSLAAHLLRLALAAGPRASGQHRPVFADAASLRDGPGGRTAEARRATPDTAPGIAPGLARDGTKA